MSAGPLAIATWEFGAPAVREAYARLDAGASAVDAVEAGIRVTESDPAVTTVGYGSLPNADGVVELDAAIMDGSDRQAGSIAALQQIRHPISVARRVMERSPHVMLVGEGALQFALADGFVRETLESEWSREEYRQWLTAGRTPRWLGGCVPDPDQPPPAPPRPEHHDTIGLAALDRQGRLAVGCSTSGMAFKSPGRVGDSPLIGAGLYVDPRGGAAAATGVGEIILRFCLSFLIVESMRRGANPQESCTLAIQRVLEADPRYATLQLGVIALGPEGDVGAASTRPPRNPLQYAVADAQGVRVLNAAVING